MAISAKAPHLSPRAIAEFQHAVWSHYRRHRRSMPWRVRPAPYRVAVSEIMLQQTQVARVEVKYPQFLRRFPNWRSLAAASLTDVLAAWQGLGYNRRALNLHKLARVVMDEYGGRLPAEPAVLERLPGVGPGTAGSIAAFAYNQPAIFIETNIRRVFLHHFFAQREGVPDREIFPLIDQTLDRRRPRQWYYALMDYGADVAQRVPNPNRRSRHYARQSKFEGSDRQIRGEIIRLLLEFPVLTAQDVVGRFPHEPPDRVVRILGQLTKEGFISQQ